MNTKLRLVLEIHVVANHQIQVYLNSRNTSNTGVFMRYSVVVSGPVIVAHCGLVLLGKALYLPSLPGNGYPVGQ